MAASPETTARRHFWLKWFWASHIVPIVILYLAVDDETFTRITLLYIVVASIWANVAAEGAQVEAAKGRS